MRRRYNPCHFCGGRVTERAVVVDYRWGDELLAIVEDVPAGVCEVCGERYFKAAVVKALARAYRARPHKEPEHRDRSGASTQGCVILVFPPPATPPTSASGSFGRRGR